MLISESSTPRVAGAMAIQGRNRLKKTHGKLLLVMQEQIRKHQIQLEILHREVAEFTHQYPDLQVIS